MWESTGKHKSIAKRHNALFNHFDVAVITLSIIEHPKKIIGNQVAPLNNLQLALEIIDTTLNMGLLVDRPFKTICISIHIYKYKMTHFG